MKCESCVYRTYVGEGGNIAACYYLIRTGHRRPCPAGDECTVYRKGSPLCGEFGTVKEEFDNDYQSEWIVD